MESNLPRDKPAEMGWTLATHYSHSHNQRTQYLGAEFPACFALLVEFTDHKL